MGYRSEVALQLDLKESQIFRRVHKVSAVLAELVSDCHTIRGLSEAEEKTDDNVFLAWSDVKWYESFACVSIIHNLLDNFDDEGYHFLRIGEENEDIEEKGCLHSEMYINRTIEW